VHDASRADVEMTDFTVAHLPVRQPHEFPAGVNQGVGIFAQQTVVSRLARQRNRVGVGFGAVSPAIEDDENQRFRTSHIYLLNSKGKPLRLLRSNASVVRNSNLTRLFAQDNVRTPDRL